MLIQRENHQEKKNVRLFRGGVRQCQVLISNVNLLLWERAKNLINHAFSYESGILILSEKNSLQIV